MWCLATVRNCIVLISNSDVHSKKALDSSNLKLVGDVNYIYIFYENALLSQNYQNSVKEEQS